MLPDNARIVKCPYCGKEKELMSLASGNTIGAEYWSDDKCIAPMLPRVSPVQKCPNCGKYYFGYKQRYKEGTKWSFERGELSFLEWKDALSQFVYENVGKEDMLNVYIEIIHSYNDLYYRNGNKEKPREEDYEYFVIIVLALIKYYDWSSVEVPLLKAELYREVGKMKECCDVLNSISPDNLKDFEKRIYFDIKQRMENNDNKVFRL